MGIVGIFLGVFGDRGARGAGGEGCFGIGVMAHTLNASIYCVLGYSITEKHRNSPF